MEAWAGGAVSGLEALMGDVRRSRQSVRMWTIEDAAVSSTHEKIR